MTYPILLLQKFLPLEYLCTSILVFVYMLIAFENKFISIWTNDISKLTSLKVDGSILIINVGYSVVGNIIPTQAPLLPILGLPMGMLIINVGRVRNYWLRPYVAFMFVWNKFFQI